MKITDKRVDYRVDFRSLVVGEVFEYLGAFYIKTGVSASEPNAVDLKNGEEDIVRLDAEVDLLNAELIVSQKGTTR